MNLTDDRPPQPVYPAGTRFAIATRDGHGALQYMISSMPSGLIITSPHQQRAILYKTPDAAREMMDAYDLEAEKWWPEPILPAKS